MNPGSTQEDAMRISIESERRILDLAEAVDRQSANSAARLDQIVAHLNLLAGRVEELSGQLNRPAEMPPTNGTSAEARSALTELRDTLSAVSGRMAAVEENSQRQREIVATLPEMIAGQTEAFAAIQSSVDTLVAGQSSDQGAALQAMSTKHEQLAQSLGMILETLHAVVSAVQSNAERLRTVESTARATLDGQEAATTQTAQEAGRLHKHARVAAIAAAVAAGAAVGGVILTLVK